MTISDSIDTLGPVRVGIVASRWNDFLVRHLVDGAMTVLRDHGIADDAIVIARPPGAFEIPIVAKAMATAGLVDVVVCLGAVIKGDTAHFEYVSEPMAHALMEIGLDTGIPCMFGVLTTYDLDQSRERAGGIHGNKGAEAATAALHTVAVLRGLAISQ